MTPIRFFQNTPENIRRRLDEIEADERYRRRVYWRAIVVLLGLTLFGLACMAAGLMSTSPVWGPTVFWLGVLAADIGFALTLAWAYLRLEH